MTTKIFRLYREIDKSLPDKRPYDTSYMRERQEVFAMLQPMQYDKHVKSLVTNVEPLKHHGRIARLRGELKQRKDDETARAKELEERMQENHMRAILQEYHDNSRAFNTMQKCIDEHRPIPKKTVQRFFARDSRSYEIKNLILQGDLETVKEVVNAASTTTSTAATVNGGGGGGSGAASPLRRLPPLDLTGGMVRSSSNGGGAIGGQATTQPPPSRLMPCFQPPSIHVDNRRSFDRARTHSKWSNEERQRLNDLYREIPLPQPQAQPEIWALYFTKVADRFAAFHKNRSKEEIREKLRTMIKRRQMKEHGEEAFWQQQQGKLAHHHHHPHRLGLGGSSR